MKIFELTIPNGKGLTNIELGMYAKKLGIKYFRGVYMRDTLPAKVHKIECGIVNLNTSHQSGSHWVCYYKNDKKRIYFDSFGQIIPLEIQRYLKTKKEFDSKQNVIQRNTDIIQEINSHICGHLCLFVLRSLTCEQHSFQDTLNNGYTQIDWETTPSEQRVCATLS